MYWHLEVPNQLLLKPLINLCNLREIGWKSQRKQETCASRVKELLQNVNHLATSWSIATYLFTYADTMYIGPELETRKERSSIQRPSPGHDC